MHKRILAFVFAAALLVALAVPLFGSGGTVEAIVDPITPADECSGNAPVGVQGAIHGFPHTGGRVSPGPVPEKNPANNTLPSSAGSGQGASHCN